MKCFACDILVDGDSGHDSKTDRYYCSACMEFTNEEILRLQDKSESDTWADKILDANPEVPLDEVEEFFDNAPEEEEQRELERIYFGTSDFVRDWN